MLEGELDLAGAPRVVEAVTGLCRDGAGSILLDIRGLRFLDSAGLRALLEAESVCAADGCSLSLTGAGPRVRRVFELAGVLDVLPFRDGSVSRSLPPSGTARPTEP